VGKLFLQFKKPTKKFNGLWFFLIPWESKFYVCKGKSIFKVFLLDREKLSKCDFLDDSKYSALSFFK
jgi:hypothetical protein